MGAVALALLLAACGSGGAEGGTSVAADPSASEATRAANGNELIECAVNGGQWFLRECEVEESRDDAGALVLVVHHPDGGFRRFTVLTDGHGLEAADGAERARTEAVDGRLDVQVGADRYRFPATIKSHAQGQ